MASLILGASLLTYNKIKESRAKKRAKRQWREDSFRELQRETEARLSASTAGTTGAGAGVGDSVESQHGVRSRYGSRSGSDSEGEKDGKVVRRVSNNPFLRKGGDGKIVVEEETKKKNGKEVPMGQDAKWWEGSRN